MQLPRHDEDLRGSSVCRLGGHLGHRPARDWRQEEKGTTEDEMAG